jgi:hypothetical protein
VVGLIADLGAARICSPDISRSNCKFFCADVLLCLPSVVAASS